ncbi:tetratricopeptide repeat protein [Granulicatella seriolae]|uniref:Tetratricopeptide repeat protein n=1 Tax=Granulicatella seriolae TaxID=2967226 RepID=A0ABT1WQJ1_9LACT|nr:tetratricopeptide repeat protein [Granulicatella seriolae]
MFDFFKKKDKKPEPIPEKKELSEVEKLERQELIAKKEEELTRLEKSSDNIELAKLYEEIGVLQADLDANLAITTLEKSFSYKPSIGDGFKTLMSLYNQKRSEAAYKGDGDGIEKWMNKMDELRQIARNNTISN